MSTKKKEETEKLLAMWCDLTFKFQSFFSFGWLSGLEIEILGS